MSAIERPHPILIHEGFLPRADALRQWALRQRFHDADEYRRRFGGDESWPGRRTRPLHDLRPRLVDEVASRVLTGLLRMPPCRYRINCTFQLTTAADGDSWIHVDSGPYQLAGLVYLTPDPPLDAGTLFYERRDGEFRITDVIANRYNRCVVFDTQRYHKSGRYFGDQPASARLTLPFFIDLEVQQTAVRPRTEVSKFGAASLRAGQ